MTNVIPRPSLRAGFHVQSSALSLATRHLHHGRTETDLHRVPKMEGLSHD